MSRGELIIDDKQGKPASMGAPRDWAAEYQEQYNGELAHGQLSHRPDQWANEFTTEREQRGPVDNQWVNEFSKLHVNDWADKFGNQFANTFGDTVGDNWESAYDEYVNHTKSDSSKGVYIFSDMNPYVGHPNHLKEGQYLVRRGLLSEAVLALEAEVLKNPDNAEGWRLLGISNAENDDDQQVTRIFNEAAQMSPEDADVHIVLGVLYNLSREFEKAISSFQTALKLRPNDYSLWKREKTLLQSTRFICVEEMLATFLLIVGHNNRYCLVRDTFGRSHFTASINFNKVLKALNTML